MFGIAIIICLAQHLDKSIQMRYTGIISNDTYDSLYRKIDMRYTREKYRQS